MTIFGIIGGLLIMSTLLVIIAVGLKLQRYQSSRVQQCLKDSMISNDGFNIVHLIRAGDEEDWEPFIGVIRGFPNGGDPETGTSWIKFAVEFGRLDAVKWMLENGADIYSLEEPSVIADIAWFTNLERPNFLEYLIEELLDINKRDSLGRTALHFAARQSSDHGIEALLAVGADPNIRDRTPSQHTPETLARAIGNIDNAKALAVKP